MNTKELVKGLGRMCAHEAIVAGGIDPTDCEGGCLLPLSPLQGGWDALEETLSRRPTPVEAKQFASAYQRIMEAEIEHYA